MSISSIHIAKVKAFILACEKMTVELFVIFNRQINAKIVQKSKFRSLPTKEKFPQKYRGYSSFTLAYVRRGLSR